MMISGLQSTPWIWSYLETCWWLHTELSLLCPMSWRSQTSLQTELKRSVVWVSHIALSLFPVFFHVASVVKLKGYGFCFSAKPSEMIAVMIIVPKGLLRLDISKLLCMKGNPVGCSVFKFPLCPYWVLHTYYSFLFVSNERLELWIERDKRMRAEKQLYGLSGSQHGGYFFILFLD